MGANRARPWPTSATQVAAVVGAPVRHSLSPVLHNAAFHALGLDWVYVAFEVSEGDGAAAVDAMRALGISGLSVTMPHKHEVAAAVDRLTPAAAALGAVNTVWWQGDEVVGDNTDGQGFLDALGDEGFDPAGRRCAVLGAGGAARAVVHALGTAGAAEVIVVNRTPERGEDAAALAGGAGRLGEAAEVGEAALIVNATPAGMDGRGLPVDMGSVGAGQLVVDLVYAPPVTPFLREARARGATATNGLGMLIHQAGHQLRRWTGQEPPLDVMSAAALAAIAAHDVPTGVKPG